MLDVSLCSENVTNIAQRASLLCSIAINSKISKGCFSHGRGINRDMFLFVVFIHVHRRKTRQLSVHTLDNGTINGCEKTQWGLLIVKQHNRHVISVCFWFTDQNNHILNHTKEALQYIRLGK